MKGTERQIKWAEDIKAAMFEEIETMRRNRAKFDALPGEAKDNNLYPYTTACIDAVEAELNLFWARPELENAAVVINNRVMLGKVVKMSADKWMKENA